MREATNKSIDGLFTAPYADFEIDLYSRDRFGHSDTSGYKMNFFVGGGSTKFGYETGFGFGSGSSLVDSDRYVMTRVGYKYLGMPFRLTAMLRPVRTSLTYEWNWLKDGLSDDGPGTLRIGGSFGAGFNLGHGYGYVRGRAAAIILPEHLDVEASVQWTPPSASTSDKDEQNWRISAWYRWSVQSKKALEIYVQKVQRIDTITSIGHDREIINGVGGGVGLSFF